MCLLKIACYKALAYVNRVRSDVVHMYVRPAAGAAGRPALGGTNCICEDHNSEAKTTVTYARTSPHQLWLKRGIYLLRMNMRNHQWCCFAYVIHRGAQARL